MGTKESQAGGGKERKKERVGDRKGKAEWVWKKSGGSANVPTGLLCGDKRRLPQEGYEPGIESEFV